MNRFILPLVGFVLLVIVFAVALQRAPDKMLVPSAMIGKPAPEFTLPDLLQPGSMVNSAAFKGNWVLLNVWGTWCVECRVEHQTLIDIAGEGKVMVVGLNYKDDDEQARLWLQDLGNPYTVIAVDQEGRAAIDYGVYGAPETFLINPEGVIIDKVVGVITHARWRETMLPVIEGTTR